MSQNLDDLRVRRTQKLIRAALIDLVEEADFDSITVGKIADRAMVSRTVFYRYYRDKYDLVERLFEETTAAVVSDIDIFRQNMLEDFDQYPEGEAWSILFEKAITGMTVPEPFVKFFDHVAEYETLYRALLGEKGSPWFRMKMRAYLTQIIDDRFQKLIDSVNKRPEFDSKFYKNGFLPTLIAGLFVDATSLWLGKGKPYSTTQIARYCYRMMCTLLKDLPNWE